MTYNKPNPNLFELHDDVINIFFALFYFYDFGSLISQ